MKPVARILIFSIYLIAYQGFAQSTASITGIVKNQAGVPLTGADAFLEGLNLGTTTDGNGQFSLNNVPAGSHVLKVKFVGYITFSKAVDVRDGAETLTINLNESLYELPEIIIERETMTGGSQFLKDIPGSAHYINLKQLSAFSYSDPNRVLRNIPGINIQEEEGFGLRPNIGMRGTGVERSSKITLMEDGILAAPAPYVAPAAYYFPTVGRMQGVEVRKGSSQIKYGPQTIGGAINFLSTPIPQDFSARVGIMGGNFGRRVAQASVGQSFKYGGFMLETYQNSAEGFKVLDSGGPTGFDQQDYLAKIRVNTAPGAKIYQSLTFKIGQTIGDSEETYLGLTQEDFDRSPYRRYAASQHDNITTRQEQYSVKYNIIPTKFMDVSLTAYRNNFSRNWYKLDAVKYNELADPAIKSVPIASVLDNPSQYANEYSLLTGSTSPNDDALFVRNNNREYYAQGIQTTIGLNFDSGIISHDLEVGFRYHKDEEDRFQWDDQYKMDNGTMMLTKAGTPGTQDNRIGDATALAGYLQYRFGVGKLVAIPGVRYESIELTRTDYGKADPGRTGASVKVNSNHVDVWIPGVGFEYEFTPHVQAFAGIHRGFAPPGSSDGTDPEKSVNYEIGSRINQNHFSAQGVLYFNDYSNLLGSDLAASGGTGTGDQFNAGAASVYGVEAEAGYVLVPGGMPSFTVPISLAYTYTYGEFNSSFAASNEDWGTVQNGDLFPYLSNHQLTINAGLDHRLFNVNLSTKYLSEMRTSPGQGEIPTDEKIGSSFIVDVAANYKLNRFLTVFGSVNNLADEVYLVARRPSGLRPGLPRSFLFGLKMNL